MNYDKSNASREKESRDTEKVVNRNNIRGCTY